MFEINKIKFQYFILALRYTNISNSYFGMVRVISLRYAKHLTWNWHRSQYVVMTYVGLTFVSSLISTSK